MDVLVLLLSVVAAAASVAACLVAARAARAAGSAADAVSDLGRRQADDAGSLASSLARVDGAQGQGLRSMEALRQDVADRLRSVDGRLDTMSSTVGLQLARTTDTVVGQLSSIREDNARQLEQMRATVDEKLERTLNDRLATSFRQISDQLESVHRGLGSMQALASDVGDLRRVLSNVKTRGILGEVQLGAILSEVLAPDQYACDVACKPGSRDRVEFAVRVPVEGGDPVLLPIDAKFPGDLYGRLVDAQGAGDAEAAAKARKELEARIRQEARDISSKYLSVPATTGFGIMFLPFEGLYAEVVSTPGLVERLQREHSVVVAGPSTMAALLNSLQLSFQTFALQRQTNEVMAVLQAVRAELPRYQDALRQAKRRIDLAGDAVDKIITTRTNAMERTLRSVTLTDGAPSAPVDAPGAGDGDGGKGL